MLGLPVIALSASVTLAGRALPSVGGDPMFISIVRRAARSALVGFFGGSGGGRGFSARIWLVPLAIGVPSVVLGTCSMIASGVPHSTQKRALSWMLAPHLTQRLAP